MSLLSIISGDDMRQPASVVLEIGDAFTEKREVYPLLKSVEIKISRMAAGVGTLSFELRRDQNGHVDILDDAIFVPWKRIRIKADFVNHQEEIIRGYVKTVTPKYPENGGDASFDVVIQDDSMLLDRDHRRTIWGVPDPQTDKQILQTITALYQMQIHPDSADGLSSKSRTQDDTPIKFLRKRATACGYELLFDEGKVYFGPRRLEGTPQPIIKVYAGRDTNCKSFTPKEEALKPDSVQVDRAPQKGASEAESEVLKPNERILGKTASVDEGSGLQPHVWRVSREADAPADESAARAQALANDNAMKVTASGELDGSMYGQVLKVGKLVSVDGVGERFGGLWYVDTVSHTLTAEGYKLRFELMRNATGEMDLAAGPFGAASAIASVVAH